MKRYICLFSAFALTIMFLTGCGGSSGSSPVSKSPAASDGNTDSPAAVPPDAVPPAGTNDGPPESFIYTTEENIIPMSESAIIDGVDCRILSCELTPEFGDRKLENLNYFYEDGGTDEKGNLINSSRYLFINFQYTNTTDSEVEILRGARGLYCIDSRFIIVNYNTDSIYIDEYWDGGTSSEVYHYKLAPGETITSEAGWVVSDELLNGGGKLYFALRMDDCLTDSGGAADPDAVFVELEY